MTKSDFNAIFIDAVNRYRKLVPYRSGHMALNAVKGQWINDTHFRIWIDRNVLENMPNIEGKVAGYYYAGKINNDPKYRTYGFAERCAREIARYIANRIGGVIK